MIRQKSAPISWRFHPKLDGCGRTTWDDPSLPAINEKYHRNIRITLLLATYKAGLRVWKVLRKGNCREAWPGTHQTPLSRVVITNSLHPQNENTLWFIQDYRKLNTVIVRDLYPSSHMNESIILLADATFFSTLYINSGSRKTEIANRGRDEALLNLISLLCKLH